MIEMRIARTPQDLFSCYKLRHDVFVDKHKYISSEMSLMFDVYDTLPNNYNLLAFQNNTLIGSLRLTFSKNCQYTPVDHYFDFYPFIKDDPYMAGSMLCSKSDNASTHLAEWLILYGYWLAQRQMVSHVTACVNPLVESLFKKCGFKGVANMFYHPEFPQPILPMVISQADFLTELNATTTLFPHQFNDHKFLIFTENELNKATMSNTVSICLSRKFIERRRDNAGVAQERRLLSLYQNGQTIYDNFRVAVGTV